MSRKRELNLQHDQFRCRGASLDSAETTDQRHVAKRLSSIYQSRSRLGMSGSHISNQKVAVSTLKNIVLIRLAMIYEVSTGVSLLVLVGLLQRFSGKKGERPVIIGVDQSHQMFFGSQNKLQVSSSR